MSLLLAWLWLFISLPPLLLLERWIHRHMQGVFLLLTRHPDLATVIYAAIFFPGVGLHELSHFLMAKLLGVETARVSLWPRRQPDGTLRLGFVETAKVDPFREALIGIAPLTTGSLVVVLIGYSRLAVGPVGAAVVQGDVAATVGALVSSFKSADAFVWLYLVFAISNSMMPSASDRRAWLPVSLALLGAALVLYFVGAIPVVMASVGEPVAGGVRAIASAFTITIGVNLFIIPVIWLLEQALIKVTGLKVNY